MILPFTKMNGAGNDFVVLDGRESLITLDSAQVRQLAARDNEITEGCDQLIVLEPSTKADVFMRIYNADGGEVSACGNATRCVGSRIIDERKDPRYKATIETRAGVLQCRMNDDVSNYFRGRQPILEANMGSPRFAPAEIPLSGNFDFSLLERIADELGIEGLVNATCVGMGNPHVVFFVKKLPALPVLEAAGARIGFLPLFSPHGVNLTIAEISQKVIFSYVYERGAGVTRSCGTGACATVAAAISLGYRKKDTNIQVQQLQREAQDLFVRWEKRSNQIFLIGPVKKEFERIVDV